MQIDHQVQLAILKQLLFIPQARFAQLNVLGLDNNHFTWHLKRLVNTNVIEKVNQHYQLTPAGLEIASRLDLKSLTIVKPPKVGVLLCVIRKLKNQTQLLLGTRRRDPGKGQTGFFATKVNFGQSLADAASQGLLRETGLSAVFTYAGTVHILDSNHEKPRFDRLMLYFRASNPLDTLKEITPDSQNFWLPYTKAYNLKDTFPDFHQDLDLFKNKTLFFQERFLSS